MKADTIAMAMKTKSISDFKSLMSLSNDLATRTYSEFQEYVNYDELMSIQNEAGTQSINNKIYPAGLLFDGPAYKALDCETLTENEVEIGITCIRFLSGLYGLLKMNDNIQRHRLEMLTKISIENSKNLYTYWSKHITEQINIEKNTILQSSSTSFTTSSPFILLNIASEEYFKAISMPHLDTDIKVIDCIFLDKGKVVSVYAKRARGLLARYICQSVMTTLNSGSNDTTANTPQQQQPSQQQQQQPIDIITRLKAFNSEGYTYDENKSKILPNCERSVLVYNRPDAPVLKKGESSKNQRNSVTATTGEDDANCNTSCNNIVNIEPKTKRSRKG